MGFFGFPQFLFLFMNIEATKIKVKTLALQLVLFQKNETGNRKKHTACMKERTYILCVCVCVVCPYRKGDSRLREMSYKMLRVDQDTEKVNSFFGGLREILLTEILFFCP